jgi:hypothetical protein
VTEIPAVLDAAPRAVTLFALRVPAETETVPVKVLAPVSVADPVRVFATDMTPLLNCRMTLETVVVPEELLPILKVEARGDAFE